MRHNKNFILNGYAKASMLNLCDEIDGITMPVDRISKITLKQARKRILRVWSYLFGNTYLIASKE